MIVGEMRHGRNGLEDQYAIREQVFVNEQGIDPNIERDEYDEVSFHCIVKEDGVLCGTGRIIIKDDEPLIGRIAVLKEYRGKQIGDLIVRMLLDFGFQYEFEKIYVHSQLKVIDFYKKIGFQEVGESYEEAGIEHKSMFITEELFRGHSCKK